MEFTFIRLLFKRKKNTKLTYNSINFKILNDDNNKNCKSEVVKYF